MAMEIAGHTGMEGYAVRTFQIDDTVVEGQPVVCIDGAGSNHGAIGDPGGVTDYANWFGFTNEAGTVSTTVGSAAVEVEITVMPGSKVIRAPISGATTIGTNLATYTNTAEDTNGLTITTTTNYDASDLNAYGAIYCRSGANAGQIRKISTNGTTTFVVVQPFDSTIAVNDVFVVLQTGIPGSISRFQMTTDFQAIDSTAGFDSAALTNEGIVWAYEGLEIAGQEKVLFLLPDAISQLTLA